MLRNLLDKLDGEGAFHIIIVACVMVTLSVCAITEGVVAVLRPDAEKQKQVIEVEIKAKEKDNNEQHNAIER